MKHTLSAIALGAFIALAPQANAAVVNFDDLSGQDTIADGYGGITWGGEWSYYGWSQYPYTPSSGDNRIYSYVSSPSFSFLTDVFFGGAFFAGYSSVYFEMFHDGISVATSSILNLGSTPTFLSSGYAGLVDEVHVVGQPGQFVLDDLSYDTTNVAAVPVPAAGFLLIGALGGLAALRRRKSLA